MKLKKKVKRTEILYVRVSKEARDRIRKMAKALNMSESEYVDQLVLVRKEC